MPWPWTMRTRLAVAITARSRNSSTASRASSARWPITLISWCTGRQLRRGPVAHVLGQLAGGRAPASGSTSITSSIGDLHLHEAGFHFDAAVRPACGARAPARARRCSRTRAPSSMRSGCDAVLARIVLRWRARWSGNPRAARAWLWRRGAALPARPCGGRRSARSCRWLPAPALRSAPAPASVRRSSSFSLAVSRFSHSRASSFSRRSSSRQLVAQALLRAPGSLRCGGAVRPGSGSRRARGRSWTGARARMMSSGMPSRVAISRPADLPGRPSCR